MAFYAQLIRLVLHVLDFSLGVTAALEKLKSLFYLRHQKFQPEPNTFYRNLSIKGWLSQYFVSSSRWSRSLQLLKPLIKIFLKWFAKNSYIHVTKSRSWWEINYRIWMWHRLWQIYRTYFFRKISLLTALTQFATLSFVSKFPRWPEITEKSQKARINNTAFSLVFLVFNS